MPPKSVPLSPVLDREAVAALLPELRNALASGVWTVDAAAVERVGQAGLQLLLSLRKSAAAQGAKASFAAPSQALRRAAQLAGLSDALALPDPD